MTRWPAFGRGGSVANLPEETRAPTKRLSRIGQCAGRLPTCRETRERYLRGDAHRSVGHRDADVVGPELAGVAQTPAVRSAISRQAAREIATGDDALKRQSGRRARRCEMPSARSVAECAGEARPPAVGGA